MTVAAALVLAPLAAYAADTPLASFSDAAPGAPPAAWKFATLPDKVATKYTIVDFGGSRVLKVESEGSYGNLVHAVKAPVVAGTSIAWRWRVDKLVEAADLKVRSGDDAAAKVCVFFAYDAAKLPLGERTRLSIARSTAGSDVPAQALCYVWDNKLAPGTSLTNAFTKRMRLIVLDSGSAKAGQWVSQKRDISADYQRMFSDESDGTVPDISGVAVAADSDNTRGHGVAYIGDITLAR